MASSAIATVAGLRLPKNVIRVYESTLWSSRQYADGAALANTAFEVFTTAISNQGNGFPAPLSISETNLQEAGRIPAGLGFTVRAVAIEPRYDDMFGVCRADLVNIQYSLCPSWRFINTEIDIAATALIGQGGGIFGATADTGAAEGGAGGSRIILNNGCGQLWQYELPVLLPANTTFAMKYRFGAIAPVVDGGIGNSDLIIRAHLLGGVMAAQPEG